MATSKVPFISCVVAVYNVEKYIEECIVSLMEQDYKDIEIILVNDGSTDNTLRICERYEALDDRIIIVNQENQGANVARNKGLSVAKGQWIYFADGDDFVQQDIFSAIMSAITDDNDVVLFANSMYKKGQIVPISYPKDYLTFSKENGDFDELLLVTMDRLRPGDYNYKHFDTVSIWNKCYRKAFLEEFQLSFVEGFPKLQDLTFNLMVFEKARKACFINHSGYVYRLNEGSVTTRYQSDFCRKLDVMEAWFTKYIDSYRDNDLMIEAYRKRLLTLLRSSIVLYFCHPNNPASFRIRKKEFQDYLSKEPFVSILKKVDIKSLPFQEKVLSWFIIHNVFEGCELLNVLRNLIH